LSGARLRYVCYSRAFKLTLKTLMCIFHPMTDEQIVIEVAKLDGFEPVLNLSGEIYKWKIPKEESWEWASSFVVNHPYLTSRDAIVPVVERCLGREIDENDILEELIKQGVFYSYLATPRQLCTALLKATGKHKEEPATAQ